MPYPDHALDVPEQTAVAAAAASAPSVLNSQPWLFTTGPQGVEVHADPRRAPTATASAQRDVYLSCGAALFTVRAALARLDRAVRVSVLPEAGDPLFVARVTVTGDGGDPEAAALYRWVGDRRTNRYPFRPEPVPAGVLALLSGAAEHEDATLRRLDAEPEYQRVLTLIRRASMAEDDAVREDRTDRLTTGVPPAVPVENLGPVPRRDGTDSGAVRDLAPDLALPGRGTAAFEPHPELAVLETAEDGPASWVAAGQALQRLLLEATGHGIAASFANQPLEDAELREEVSSSAAHFGHPQMVLRMGYPLTRPPAAPRRPQHEVLRRVGR